MLKVGDRVMVLKTAYSPHYVRLTTVKRLHSDGVRIWCDDYPSWAIWKASDLAQLPLLKEPCPMCGSTERYHNTTTCERDHQC